MRTSRLILCTRCAVLAAIALSLPRASEAQPKEENCTLLIYQIGDLVLNVRDYPYPDGSGSSLAHVRVGMGSGMYGGMGSGMGGGMGGGTGGGMGMGSMGGGMGNPRAGQNSSSAPAQITMDDILLALTSMVEPTSWDEVGGPGSVQPLGTSLLVSQTAAVHQQIEGFLKQLREGSGERKTVTIDARWLFLDSDELDELIPPQEGGPQVDRKVLATFTRRPSSIRGLTNCFNNQLVYLVSGTRRNVVSSYIPVVGSLDRPEERAAPYASLKGGARYILASESTVPGVGSGRSVGYQPVVEKPNFGVLLEIRPTLVFGEDTAIVDLRSTLTVLGEQPGGLLGQPALELDHVAPVVDRVAIETQELATTLGVPLGQPVLVGGLTYVSPSIGSFREQAQAGAKQPQEAPTETPQLYLILELR